MEENDNGSSSAVCFDLRKLNVSKVVFSLLDLHFWILVCLAGLIACLGNGIWMVGYNFLIQMETPKDAVGREFGIRYMISSFVAILAPLTGGVLIQIMGAAEFKRNREHNLVASAD